MRPIVVVHATNVADADAVAVVPAHVSAHDIKRSACLYDAIEPNDVVVAYVAPAAVQVPLANSLRADVHAWRRSAAVQNDALYISHFDLRWMTYH